QSLYPMEIAQNIPQYFLRNCRFPMIGDFPMRIFLASISLRRRAAIFLKSDTHIRKGSVTSSRLSIS
ncbi:hypothetical protein PENTCL1PPCAC_546, partial [Pristionchus entomophagus]